MSDLPKNKNKPSTINGIKVANRNEYDKRVREDAEKMAQFLYSMYQDHRRKQLVISKNNTVKKKDKL